ncbi:MAG: redoxin domain-containing protein [Pirellulales bacterium]|nr:redoxin domain-containing protein [Pirellulales bacterium]
MMNSTHAWPTPKWRLGIWCLLILLAGGGILSLAVGGGEQKETASSPGSATVKPEESSMAPELTGLRTWFNSEPLELRNLRGKVVLVHFWTFGCINCLRNLPLYNQWQADFAKQGVVIIGVHTPEFDHEADSQAVAEQLKKHKIDYAVATDPDSKTWDAFKNRYWPAIYVIDRQGHIRHRWEGELEHNQAGGDGQIRTLVERLLAEQPR